MGPLPLSPGNSYLLTCIDRFSRWPEAFSVPNITAETIAKTFVASWIALFGVPSSVSNDRCRQLESAFIWKLIKLLGCSRIHTTEYHSMANGVVERFHLTLKPSLQRTMTVTTGASISPLGPIGTSNSPRGRPWLESCPDGVWHTTLSFRKIRRSFRSSCHYRSPSYATQLTTAMRACPSSNSASATAKKTNVSFL